MRLTTVILLTSALSAPYIYAAGHSSRVAESRASQQSVETLRRLYFQAHEGNKEAAQDCAKLLGQLHEQFPADPLVLAYYGSVKLRESSSTIAIWRKGRLAKEGLQALDEAVQRAPEDLEVRFLRAATTFHLPGLFKREQQTQNDLAWLAGRVIPAAESGRLERRFASAALHYHGVLLKRHSEDDRAREAWGSAIRVGPGTNGAAEAAKKLTK